MPRAARGQQRADALRHGRRPLQPLGLRQVLEHGQDRRDRPDARSVVGQDIGSTPGFTVYSLNAGYRPKKGTLISAGIDNLFDKAYAEHISRAGAAVAGYTQTTRVNEPGRNLWLKASMAFE